MENRNPETVEELYNLGLAFLEKQDWLNAIKCFKGVLVVDPEHESATMGLQEAEKQLELADSYGKGHRAFYDGEWEEAIKHFDKVVSLDRNYKDAAAKLEEARKQKELLTIYELGSQHYRKKEWAEAIEQFEKIVSLDSAYVDAAAMLRVAKKKRLADDIAARKKTLVEYYNTAVNSSEKLPIEYPFKESLKIFGRRLAILLVVVLLNFVLLGVLLLIARLRVNLEHMQAPEPFPIPTPMPIPRLLPFIILLVLQ